MDVDSNPCDWHCNGRKALYPASLPLLLQYMIHMLMRIVEKSNNATVLLLPVAPRPVKIATLDYYKPATRFHTVELFPVRRSGSKAVLRAAKFLLGVSSSLGTFMCNLAPSI